MPDARRAAKSRRREELIAAAARIMAERGFRQTTLDDVGSAVGVSGPAVYRHFSGKAGLLAAILIDISIRLVDGARAVLADRGDDADPAGTLRALIDFHVDFAVTEPDRIRIQEREIGNLDREDRDKVRSLQRTYVGLWSDAVRAADPSLDAAAARLRVQLAAGLINSSQHVLHWAGGDAVAREARAMALRAFDLGE
ncbi:TetR/AcrR family transcriptional regulator [Corynebacterium sp.]|uniref:TetR/AcrR family transcriptional regulator n=1 Tax=Corynebacterium sp. TaxID=1720 RepID=UPI0026DBCE9D|nr:TetR/AcrR family transcriptional regulator [Corynebacterium sp.]MDO4610180.1 TetR/AcrR family transcriptional regulator [Corynebacterium sp.]